MGLKGKFDTSNHLGAWIGKKRFNYGPHLNDWTLIVTYFDTKAKNLDIAKTKITNFIKFGDLSLLNSEETDYGYFCAYAEEGQYSVSALEGNPVDFPAI